MRGRSRPLPLLQALASTPEKESALALVCENVNGGDAAEGGESATATKLDAADATEHETVRSSFAEGARGSDRRSAADEYGGGGGGEVDTLVSRTDEAASARTRRTAGGGSDSAGNTQPSGEAPHDRGAGVTDDDGVTVLDAVADGGDADDGVALDPGSGCVGGGDGVLESASANETVGVGVGDSDAPMDSEADAPTLSDDVGVGVGEDDSDAVLV